MTVRSELEALLLAAVDMEQVIAAAEMLKREAASGAPDPDRVSRLQALETAIAVCYVRSLRGNPKETWRVADEEVLPTDQALHGMHETIIRMRNKACAHMDRKAGTRAATADPATGEVELQWLPIPAEAMGDVIALAAHQRDRFLDMASRADDAPVDERQEQIRVVASLHFAEHDLDEALLAAKSIPNPDYAEVRSLLVTAFTVSYARPFTSSRAGMMLAAEWKPEAPDDLALHKELMDMRHTAHAHTDDNEFRSIRSLAGFIDGAPDIAIFVTRSLSDEFVAFVTPMIKQQRDRFMKARHERVRRLGAASDPRSDTTAS